jgi:hypothetical protein
MAHCGCYRDIHSRRWDLAAALRLQTAGVDVLSRDCPSGSLYCSSVQKAHSGTIIIPPYTDVWYSGYAQIDYAATDWFKMTGRFPACRPLP